MLVLMKVELGWELLEDDGWLTWVRTKKEVSNPNLVKITYKRPIHLSGQLITDFLWYLKMP